MNIAAKAIFPDAQQIALARNKQVLDQARAEGLLGSTKDARLSGRVSSGLLAAAKQRAHVVSDSELIELALARMALEDDFGSWLVSQKGSIPQDIDLAF